MTINLINILKVDDMESYFTIQFELQVEWVDSRLLFRNLQEKENAVQNNEWRNIWIPNFSLYPTKFFEETALMSSDSKALLQLSLNDSAIFFSEYIDKRNTFIYPGNNVKILKNQKLTIDFICAYNWINYPFDTQICNISLQLISIRSDQVKINHEVINLINAFSTFAINMSNSFVEYTNGGIPAITMTIEFQRDFKPMVLNTFLPTMLLVIINQLTNYYDEISSLEGIIGINASIMMTLGSIFISTFNSAPASTYVKLIDVWMIVILFYPVIVILCHSIKAVVTKEKSKRRMVIGRYILMFLQCLMPVLFIIFCVAYWIYGMRIYYGL